MQSARHKDGSLTVDQYTVLAELYDHLMQHVDYKLWCDYVFRLLKKHGRRPESIPKGMPNGILEIACGTGSLLREIKRYCGGAVGMDKSIPMLKKASEKLRDHSSGFPLVNGDIASPPFKARFSTILCLYDSMNYLESLNHLIETVETILSLLEPGGVFIFDVCTEYNSRQFFNGHYYSNSYKNFFYTRKSLYDTKKKTQTNDFVITNSVTGQIWKEHHRQTIYGIEEIYSSLQSKPLRRIEMFKNYSLKPPDTVSERVHFYLEKGV
ncbi:class I SAM-dependent DNA methyltransferase [candidate division KSB1 bacterium]